MRVLLVNTTCGHGGAAQIVTNLLAEFPRVGVDARALVARNQEALRGPIETITPERGWLERLTKHLAWRGGLGNCGILHSFELAGALAKQGIDIVHLHNLHGGYFNFLALPGMTRRTPAVLTLHDMWPFTGHCAYSFDCGRWSSGCGSCPYPDTYPGIRRDATHLEWRLKRWAFSNSDIHFVAISRWIAGIARRRLGTGATVHFIPNGIDLETFAPQPQAPARRALGLPQDRHIILYAAQQSDDPRKGFDLLAEALGRLPEAVRARSSLLVMGHAEIRSLESLPVPVIALGFVADDRDKARAFAAADVFALPTRADNLPVVLQESLACGLPMVAFDVGGIGDLVRPEQTGLRSRAEDVQAFADDLQRLLQDRGLRQRMRRQCRRVAENEYALRLQAQRYRQLFETIRGRRENSRVIDTQGQASWRTPTEAIPHER